MNVRSEQRVLDELRGRHILVLGDLILDRYTWGSAERVSPEAPVLVLNADEHEVRPGGAASVAVLLRNLEAHVTLAGVIGDDNAGQSLLKVLRDEQVDLELVHTIDGRPTTTKERFVGRASNRHPHQILRVDHETREIIDHETAVKLRDGITKRISEFGAVLVSDYAKGVCSPELLNDVINAARSHRIPAIVDPAKIVDYERYRRASLITPNRSEAGFVTNTTINSPTDALSAGKQLVEQLSLDGAFVTIDRDGIAVVEKHGGQRQQIVSAKARDVYDITGAGDMVLAIAGLCQAAGWSLVETARLANTAAGLEIEQLGIARVSWDQIAKSWFTVKQVSAKTHHSAEHERIPNTKITTLSQLGSQLARDRCVDKTIVFSNGCFDLLHAGHVTFLQEAATLGDVLVVAINSDESIKRLKGPQRPIINQTDRATMLASLACVDHVIVFDDDTPHRLLDLLRPDVLVKGGTTPDVIGREVVEAYGGQVLTTRLSAYVSTTHIVDQIQKIIGTTETATPILT